MHLNFPVLASTALLIVAATVPHNTHAAVRITGTRVIYPEGEREVTVDLTNTTGGGPRLVQAWTDRGASSDATESDAPFVVTPPVSRIEPGQGQALRVTYTGESLPVDRESVFWLNVLEIPPMMSKQEQANYLQLAVRHRIKILYRPSGLVGSPSEAMETLSWRVAENGGKRVLSCTNPSPFNVSFTGIQAHSSGASASLAGGMCAAKAATVIPLPETLGEQLQLSAYLLNDHGGVVRSELLLTD